MEILHMKRKIQTIFVSLVAALGIALSSLALPAGAVGIFGGCTGGVAPSAPTGNPDAQTSANTLCGATAKDSAPDIIKNVINLILIVLGMVAVIMIIIGGIRYTTSNGDSSNVKAAKDTILYAVVGLVVAIMSYAIVNFVLGRFSGSS